jgi:alpha-ketoglutarate-dependent taurine dioxygenase
LDSYKAIELFAADHPDLLRVLTDTPVTFHYQNNGHHLRYRRPTVQMDNENQPLHVYYAPPFMGPLEAHASQVEAFYDAFKKLQMYMEDSKLIYSYKLRPGDCVVFANRRVLHGRTAFDARSGSRHLKGTYVDWDAMKDKLRVLRDKMETS